MRNSKEQTTVTARTPKPIQQLQPNKTCKCSACVLDAFAIASAPAHKPKLPSGMRRLKVYSKYSTGYNQVPVIMLQGEWLRNTGFDIGDKILVTVNKKQLIVSFEKG